MAKHETQQKQRQSPESSKARAKGGDLRKQPTEGMPGRSASTGGLTTKSMLRNDQNSRSSNAGRQGHK
jgi:hypothetical protein